MRQMTKTKEPVVLTVNGKAALVVQDAESHQKLLQPKERSEVVEILRQRLASRSGKKGRPAEDFFNEFFARNNILVEDLCRRGDSNCVSMSPRLSTINRNSAGPINSLSEPPLCLTVGAHRALMFLH